MKIYLIYLMKLKSNQNITQGKKGNQNINEHLEKFISIIALNIMKIHFLQKFKMN